MKTREPKIGEIESEIGEIESELLVKQPVWSDARGQASS